ncbi:MAG TPA: hypothetical protein VKS79_19810 [Gemmataceae bacterium]|nr:hypothetical protein [Gemmataceae bacterium]
MDRFRAKYGSSAYLVNFTSSRQFIGRAGNIYFGYEYLALRFTNDLLGHTAKHEPVKADRPYEPLTMKLQSKR